MLAVGSRLGPYEVIAPLGAGGMGEVYRARDTRLERTVAIKVLADALTGDPQLRQRLFAEARAISQLSHPHICTLHDIGDHQGTTFLVMEFLDGETLADRISRGREGTPALSVGTAIEIAIQVGEALAIAHRQGIVHRDLKPGNIMLGRTAGARQLAAHAKLLDFGLAKTHPPVGTGGATVAVTTPPQAVTAQGAILGTFHYMAPELLEGGDADARADIFAFGCVLFEMLTGQKAFDGKSPAAIMAAVLEREPPAVTTLQPAAPTIVDEIVQRCLAKNPDERWQSASDVVVALRWAAAAALKPAPAADNALPSPSPSPSPASAVAARWRSAGRARVRKILVLFLGGAVAGAAIMSGIDRRRGLPAELTTRFEVLPPPGASWSPSPVSSAVQLSLSADGRRLAFVAAAAGSPSQLWIRSLDSLQAQPLVGTEGASFPFWSPDGRWLGFFADRKLKKIESAGGPPQTLCDAPAARGGTWNADGVILFTPSPNTAIHRVSASGGAATPITELNTDIQTQYWPQFLPDGRRFIFFVRTEQARRESQGIYVGTLDAPGITRVLPADGMAVYAHGHLLFARDASLLAQPVDERTLAPTGEPQPVGGRVGQFVGTAGFSGFTASHNGHLAYGPPVTVTTQLTWRERGGKTLSAPLMEGPIRSPRISPDGTRVTVTLMEERTSGSDVWIVDSARGTRTRVTTDPWSDWFPAWSSDGRVLFFSSTRGGSSNVFKRGLGAASDEVVTPATGLGRYPMDVTGDGGLLAVQLVDRTGYDLAFFDLQGKNGLRPFLSTPFNEVQPRISPDGRWVAYSSDESGIFQIYVRALSGNGPSVPVSIDGGMQPEWARNGKELFYVAANRELMSVSIIADGAGVSPGLAKPLFKVAIPEPSAPYQSDYAVSHDGQRFLVNSVAAVSTQRPVTVALNWASALNARK